MLRRTIMFATALAVAAAVAAPAVAQTTIGTAKIAVLDVRRILSDSAAGKDALARLKKLTEDKEAQGRGMQQELVDLENKMKAGRLSLAEDALAKLQKDYEDKGIALKRFQDDANRELGKARDEAFADIERQVMPVIDQVGKELGVTLIFNKFESGLVFADDSVDVTAQVLAKFNATAKPAGK
jgi:outer membrane protein